MEVCRSTNSYLKMTKEPQMSKKWSKYGCIIEFWFNHYISQFFFFFFIRFMTDALRSPFRAKMVKKWRILLHMLIWNVQISSWKKWREAEMKNVSLYPQEPSKPILKNLGHNRVNFDHFGNKYKNKDIGIILELSVKILLITCS